MKKTLAFLVAVLVGFAFVMPARAENLEQVKERMKARLPAVTALLATKAVGENNKGYLEFVAAERAQADVVQAENADRRAVYAAIASSTNTTADMVGQRRALKIGQEAAPGTMIQDAAGKWAAKK